MGRIVAPLVDKSEVVTLPVDAFVPCNYVESSKCYWLAFWHQAIGTSVATLTHAAKDCLISGMLIQTCCQLEILELRFLNISKLCEEAIEKKKSSDDISRLENNLISNCVNDHSSIFK